MRGAVMYGPARVRRSLPELLDLISRRAIDLGKVFDLEPPLEEAADGYRAMVERRDQGGAELHEVLK